jgi:hypothetical protein
MAKFTPGPWEAVRMYSNGCEVCPRILAPRGDSREGRWVATVVGAPSLEFEETWPNAVLIAAAPDMVELLRDAARDPDLMNIEEVYDHAVAACKRARRLLARIDAERGAP